MKLKKVLASALAAAMTLTTVVTTSFAAEDITLTTGSLGEAELVEDQWNPGAISNPNITLDNKWGNAFAVEGYSSAEITYTCGNPSDVANIYLVAQSGTMPNSWYQQMATPAESGTITLDFSSVQDKTYECLLVSVQPIDTYSIGDNFNPDFTVTSAKLISAVKDETVYATQDITSYYADGTFNGTFDMSKVSGPNAKMEVTFTTTGGWGGIKLLDKTDVDAGNYDNPVTTIQGDADAGEYTKTIKLADVSIPTNLCFNTWSVASIDSVVIYNAESAGNVFTAAAAEETTSYAVTTEAPENGTVSVDKTTAAEGDTVTITAKAAEGYEVDTITVTGDSGDVEVAEDGTFTMPAEAVTVTVTFKAVEGDEDDTTTDSGTTGDDDVIEDEPTDEEPEVPEVEEPEIEVPVVIETEPKGATLIAPVGSIKKFEIADPVTGKTISASVNRLAKALSRIEEGTGLEFSTGDFGMTLRKNVIQEVVDNDLTLTIKTSKATFIIDAENLAMVKTINIPAIMKTATFKELIKEGDTFIVKVTEKNKVEIELA